MKDTATLETLYKLKKEILKSENRALVSQIDHAIMKTYRDQFVFSFIGHYSAGKSSLINHLLNQDILPSSPVPTTSNTVSVEIGEAREIEAYVDQYRYIPLENYEELRALNTQDLDITSISMNVPHSLFKERTVFQDTPGVDSNTDSHAESANRFLLNSDYIFFTVEYNHVESESNMKLLKEISDLKIPFSLIINQVDKHDDSELSMETFLSRIRNTLDRWNIIPERIFTTTIYDSPYNEVNRVTEHIMKMEGERERHKRAYHDRITGSIEHKQLEYLEAMLSDLYEELGMEEPAGPEAVRRHIDYLAQEIENSRIDDLHNDPEALKSYVRDQAKDIAVNSYLYPHGVKSAIEDFLRVLSGEMQPSGFFGKEKKRQRLYADHKAAIGTAISPVIETEVNAPINGLFDSLGLSGEPFKYEWDEGLLIEEEITTLSASYTLNYLDKLKRKMESDIARQAALHLEGMSVSASREGEDRDKLAGEKASYEAVEHLLGLKTSVETANYRHFYIHLDDEMDRLDLTEAIDHDFETAEAQASTTRDHIAASDQGDMDLGHFRNLRNMLEDHPRYDTYRKVIDDKLARIDEGSVNISVFGGFSAGKTTFINALMGSAHLTTSPNPTTATITEISDGTESHAVYKREEDLVQTLEVISNRKGDAIGDFLPWIRKNMSNVKEAYIPFLQGIRTHYEKERANLGQDIVMPREALIRKISTDEEAIFIHKAYLSITNALTEQFSIIDSPGINSINDRHTKETHNIIANSDMLIYVSYYNHVFSQSDERFLQYIKSIKGADFPIIFIVNAVDLMRSEADLDKVVRYIRSALDRMDIRSRIFPVSSKKALDNGDAGFDHAKEEIIQLANRNAAKIQYDSLVETDSQLEYAIRSNIRRYHNQSEERARIEAVRTALIDRLSAFSAHSITPTLYQEIDIILTHVKKQLKLKLYDHLKGLITPSDMKDRKFITGNQAFLENSMDRHLTLELSTSFNAVYHKADDVLGQEIKKMNEELKTAQTARHLESAPASQAQPEIHISSDTLLSHQKPLQQARNQARDFRTRLLDLSEALVEAIDYEKLQSEMENMIHAYLEQKEDRMAETRETIIHALKTPLPEISAQEYEEDRLLIERIGRREEVQS